MFCLQAAEAYLVHLFEDRYLFSCHCCMNEMFYGAANSFKILVVSIFPIYCTFSNLTYRRTGKFCWWKDWQNGPNSLFQNFGKYLFWQWTCISFIDILWCYQTYTVCSFQTHICLAFWWRYCTHTETDGAHVSESPWKPSLLKVSRRCSKYDNHDTALGFVELSCKKGTSNGHDWYAVAVMHELMFVKFCSACKSEVLLVMIITWAGSLDVGSTIGLAVATVVFFLTCF